MPHLKNKITRNIARSLPLPVNYIVTLLILGGTVALGIAVISGSGPDRPQINSDPNAVSGGQPITYVPADSDAWKLYRNTTHKYSLRVPPDWEVIERDDNIIIVHPLSGQDAYAITMESSDNPQMLDAATFARNIFAIFDSKPKKKGEGTTYDAVYEAGIGANRVYGLSRVIAPSGRLYDLMYLTFGRKALLMQYPSLHGNSGDAARTEENYPIALRILATLRF